MGLGGTLGSAAGTLAFGPLGGIAGGLLGGMFDGGSGRDSSFGMQQRANDARNTGYNNAISATNTGYNNAFNLFNPMINQTAGSIGQYNNLLGNLGQGYSESPGLKAESQLLNQKLAANGLSHSPTGVSTAFSPLVANDYNNYYNRQLGQLNAFSPLMNMYNQGIGNQSNINTGLANNLSNLNVNQGLGEMQGYQDFNNLGQQQWGNAIGALGAGVQGAMPFLTGQNNLNNSMSNYYQNMIPS